MKKVQSVVVARPVKVVQNTSKPTHQWGQIKCADSGRVLHTGQLNYIRQIARAKYNVRVTFAK